MRGWRVREKSLTGPEALAWKGQPKLVGETATGVASAKVRDHRWEASERALVSHLLGLLPGIYLVWPLLNSKASVWEEKLMKEWKKARTS